MRIAHSILSIASSISPLQLPSFAILSPPCSNVVVSMAGTAENGFSTDAVLVVDDDAKFGFQRPEMHSSKLSGTVDAYDRHVFLSYKTHEEWPSRIEDSDSDPLPKLLSGALKARKNDIALKTRLTICEGSEGTDGDILIFPEMIKYRGLKDSDVDGFVEEVLVNGKTWASGIQEVLTGSHIFVCAHNSRDKRCGVCGPALIDKFNEEIELRGLKGQVFVSACSHIGGHKYAGNLIIFSADADGKISGHWYGYVAPTDVSALLDRHIGNGEIIEHLWRGQMGGRVEESQKVEEQKLSNGNDLNINEKAAPPQEIVSEKENGGGCCQGANGISCCRDENSEEKQEKTKAPRGLGSLSCCGVGKWEQHEFLTAAAVVGAVATVVVAYSFYKKSR